MSVKNNVHYTQCLQAEVQRVHAFPGEPNSTNSTCCLRDNKKRNSLFFTVYGNSLHNVCKYKFVLHSMKVNRNDQLSEIIHTDCMLKRINGNPTEKCFQVSEFRTVQLVGFDGYFICTNYAF